MQKTYGKPEIIDHGGLRELTEACVFGTGGDAAFPSGQGLGVTFGTSNPSFGCTSD